MRLWPILAICLILVSRPGAAQPIPPAWETDSRTGCRVWVPIRFPDRVLTWLGPCKDGLGEGPGIAQWSWHGQPNGSFEGTLRGGKAEGPGTLHWPDPTIYTGAFHDGLPNGTGKEVDPAGDGFEGEFRDGQFTGHGVLNSEYGVRYEGEFLDFHLHGGPVVITFPNGDRIQSDMHRAGQHVRGTLTMANGARYEGQFDAGSYLDRHDAAGQGTLTLPSGKVYRGHWIDGCLRIGARQIAIDGTVGTCK
jgi:hypothetical protein